MNWPRSYHNRHLLQSMHALRPLRPCGTELLHATTQPEVRLDGLRLWCKWCTEICCAFSDKKVESFKFAKYPGCGANSLEV